MRAWSRINSRVSIKYSLVHDNVAATLGDIASRCFLFAMFFDKRIRAHQSLYMYIYISSLLALLGHFAWKFLATSFALFSLSFFSPPANQAVLSTLFTAIYTRVCNININRMPRELRLHFMLELYFVPAALEVLIDTRPKPIPKTRKLRIHHAIHPLEFV